MDDIENQPLNTFRFTRGYINTDRLSYPPDCLAEGSKNLIITGNDSLRVFRGIKSRSLTAGRTMFQVANGWAALQDDGGTQGIGSIFNYMNESLMWIGGGKVNINGTVPSDSVSGVQFTASSGLSISPKISGSYSRAYVAGFDQPSSPTVVVRTGTPGSLNGVYSFKIARIRSATGARSVASKTSAAVECSNETVRLTFPSAASNGQDRWQIFGTKAGFGGTGVHYLWKEIAETDLSTIDGIGRSYEVSYSDPDLLPVTAYIDDDPPPTGSFAARLENYVAIIGAYTNAIAISVRNFPESFIPDCLAFLPKAPTAVLPDQQGSYIYIATSTSVHALSVAPAAGDNPMMLQTVWSDTGISHPHNWCAYEGVIFAFVSRQGAVTMDALGHPSAEFALDVAKEMKDWNVDDTRVFPCPDLNSVIYINSISGAKKALMFNLQNRKWSTPCFISDFVDQIVMSGVVINRRLQIALGNSSTFALYEFDEQPASGTTNYKAVTPDVMPNPSGRINVLGMLGHFCASDTDDLNKNTNIKLFCDYSPTATKTLTHTAGSVGMQTTKQTRWFLPRKRSIRVSIEGSQATFTNDCFPSFVTVYGTVENSNKF